jgi:hypothetical protein
MFGYLGGVAVAVTVDVYLTVAWIKGTPFFFSELGLWSFFVFGSIFVNWVTALLPFFIVRGLMGKGRFEKILPCALAGIAVRFLTLLIDWWLFHAINFKGPFRPYLEEVGTAIAGFWPILLIGGALGGIVYWWIEDGFPSEPP